MFIVIISFFKNFLLYFISKKEVQTFENLIKNSDRYFGFVEEAFHFTSTKKKCSSLKIL